MQTEPTEESEEKAKPEKLEDVRFDEPFVQTSSLFVSRMSALLDFFSDRAVAHASFFVASIFGIVTLLNITQQLDDNSLAGLSILLYFGFSYAGYFTLARFSYYATIADKLSDYGLRRQETFEKIIISKKGGSLEDYMKQKTDEQVASLLPRKISAKSSKWYMRIIIAVYWIAMFILGLIGYSKSREYSSIERGLWFGGFMLCLVVIIVVVPPLYHHIRKK